MDGGVNKIGRIEVVWSLMETEDRLAGNGKRETTEHADRRSKRRRTQIVRKYSMMMIMMMRKEPRVGQCRNEQDAEV